MFRKNLIVFLLFAIWFTRCHLTASDGRSKPATTLRGALCLLAGGAVAQGFNCIPSRFSSLERRYIIHDPLRPPLIGCDGLRCPSLDSFPERLRNRGQGGFYGRRSQDCPTGQISWEPSIHYASYICVANNLNNVENKTPPPSEEPVTSPQTPLVTPIIVDLTNASYPPVAAQPVAAQLTSTMTPQLVPLVIDLHPVPQTSNFSKHWFQSASH